MSRNVGSGGPEIFRVLCMALELIRSWRLVRFADGISTEITGDSLQD
jgi:hypothetical protein